MKKRTLFNFGTLALLALGVAIQTSRAVILFGSGDPSYNTTPPTGELANSGWQYEGQWGGFLGTPIAPQYFIAAHHVGGSVGQTFTFQGCSYTTTAYWDDPDSDLRIWKVDGTFPVFAPLYTNSDELGKTLVDIGRGTQRGDPVVVTEAQTVYTTNVVDLKVWGIKRKDAEAEFPDATFKGQIMTVVTSEVVTNEVLKGWQDGPSDHVTRWGENQVCAAGGFLVAAFTGNFGPNEAYLSGGDSSGGVFIQDRTGEWKLAGLNYAIVGPFATSPDDPAFYGAIFDESGLYDGSVMMPCDGTPHPAYYFATRVSTRLAWIQSIIGQ
ncbi:MAG TPA: hypothetical protein VFY06_04885 [Verrucomicrobiae bacterium]|nr:hypothetical protein [Verrucomicrobiae bacterium]